jgi:putative transposase
MFKGRHFDQSVILLRVSWYLAYNLSLRDLEEMMAERSLKVDHSTVHNWVAHFSPQLLERFNRRKRTVGSKWQIDETYIKVRLISIVLSTASAIRSSSSSARTLISENRDLPAAKRFLRKALQRHVRPERIVIDGNQTNHGAMLSCDAESRLRQRSRRALKSIRIRKSQYFNNRIQ